MYVSMRFIRKIYGTVKNIVTPKRPAKGNQGFLLLPAETGLVLFSVGCPWKQMKKEYGGFLVCKYGE